MAYDTFRGTVPLPDGRQIKATVHGHNFLPTFWDPGYFEVAEDDALELDTWVELTPDDEMFCVEWLFEHGVFEEWQADEP